MRELIGQKFGMLTVIDEVPKPDNILGHRWWLCVCDCGGIVDVSTKNLTRGATDHCGCQLKIRRKIGCDKAAKSNTKHGMSDSSEYRSWACMNGRCNNPNNGSYHKYGGRGIKVCPQWSGRDGFEQFYADMGPKPTINHTIDRIDPNDDYTPENCRWATRKEQNRHRSNNKIVTYQGKTQTLIEWSEELNIPIKTLINRLRANWSVERAFTQTRETTYQKVEYKGKVKPLKQWAIELDMPYYLLLQRISNRRWSIDRAFTEPINEGQQVTINGKTQSIYKWIVDLDISQTTVYDRIKRGWSVKDALLTPAKDQKNDVEKLTFNGRTLPLKEWAKEIDVTYTQIRNRIKKGLPIEKILAPKKSPGGQITYNGKTQSINKWAEEYGIGRTTIKRRLAAGMTMREVLSGKVLPRRLSKLHRGK